MIDHVSAARPSAAIAPNHGNTLRAAGWLAATRSLAKAAVPDRAGGAAALVEIRSAIYQTPILMIS